MSAPSEVGGYEFQDNIQIGPVSPYVSNSMYSRVAFSLQLTNNFIRELNTAKSETGFDFITIVNTQVDAFQLIRHENCRLETRFSALAYKVKNKLNGKCRSGRKRQQFLSDTVSVSILQNELQNVKSLVSEIGSFKIENVQLEKKCSDLFEQLKDSKVSLSELDLENSTLRVSEISARSQNNKLENESGSLRGQLKSLSKHVTALQNTAEAQQNSIDNLESERNGVANENEKLRHQVLKSQTQVHELSKPRVKFDISKNKFQVAKDFGEKAKSALWFAELYGLVPNVLTCSSTEKQNVEIDLQKTTFSNLDNDDKENIRSILFILDKFAVSDSSYHELSILSKDLPTLTAVKTVRKELNSNFSIMRCPGNTPGAFVSIEEVICQHIRTNKLNPDEKIKVKFSGDGAKVSRLSNFVTLSISFPDSSRCRSEIDIKTIAIVKCSENYENIKITCNPILIELNSLIDSGSILVDDLMYPVEILFGGDMKFMQLCLGLNGSTANYACPWCIVSKNERLDLSKDVDYYESKQFKRTLKSLHENAIGHKLGSKHMPLIKVDPSNVVIDELHLLLRICDVLLTNLIDDCRQADSKLEVLGQSPHHLKDLVNKVRECGVSFSTFIDKGSSDLNWTALTGKDYKKLLNKLPEKLCFVIQNDTLDDVVFIWREFEEIHKLVSNNPPEKTDIFLRIKNWMVTFQAIEKKGRIGYGKITPYMHALLYHVPTLIERHGPLSNYSGQSVEKLNDVLKLVHHKSSNKQNQTFDELTTRKRIEQLASTDCVRKKRKYIKKDFHFWEQGICDQRQAKVRKVNNEISNAHAEYMSRQSVSEAAESPDSCNLEAMSVIELKEKAKSLGLTTRLRAKPKLIQLIQQTMNK